jgi:hypothetical protein
MKIGILGIRGIPNQYGGFEQFTEFVAPALVNAGHEIIVYNSSLHPYKESTWNGVQLIKKFDPENRIGTAGQFIYDFNCIMDSRKRNFDIILQLGYTSSSIWHFLFPSRSVVVTNMDGLEWKRSKYSKPVQRFLKLAERWAALKSDALISDSLGIQSYLENKYNRKSAFIAYGATIFNSPDPAILSNFNLEPYKYSLLIARMEPENNIEPIIRGYLASQVREPLVIIGSGNNKFGAYLQDHYSNEVIRFAGSLYDLNGLNNLRHFSRFYFHGHSVGGTNPSLLEAMASDALIIANDNVFNKSVLGEQAFYFGSDDDIASILKKDLQKVDFSHFLHRNKEKIRTEYSWPHIIASLESYLKKCISR